MDSWFGKPNFSCIIFSDSKKTKDKVKIKNTKDKVSS